MRDRSTAEASGVNQEGGPSALVNSKNQRRTSNLDRAGKVLSGEMDIADVLRLAREEHEEDEKDIVRLDWLQARGRVKARKYGDMKDNFMWDVSHPASLRETIDARMIQENTEREPRIGK